MLLVNRQTCCRTGAVQIKVRKNYGTLILIAKLQQKLSKIYIRMVFVIISLQFYKRMMEKRTAALTFRTAYADRQLTSTSSFRLAHKPTLVGGQNAVIHPRSVDADLARIGRTGNFQRKRTSCKNQTVPEGNKLCLSLALTWNVIAVVFDG